MNGLGVGGSQSPDLVNAANALLYAFMTVTCFLGPWVGPPVRRFIEVTADIGG